MVKKTLAALLAVLLLLACLPVSVAAEGTGFTDVPANAWYADAAVYCRDHGLMNGTGDGIFSPDLPMSRGMLATVLYQMAGSPAVSSPADFEDVPADQWFAAPVAWAAEKGLVSGYGDGLFGPEDTVTREQAAVILWKYAGSPEAAEAEPFADAADIAPYAATAARWARASGIINGKPGNLFAPAEGTTRAQAAQILMAYDLLQQKETEPTPETTVEPTAEPSAVPNTAPKVLVAYFSATNNTEGVAQKLADGLGADLFEILPAVPYTSEDLNYGNSSSRTSDEQNDPSARPAIANTVEDMDQYDVVFLGYPIWWGIAPRIMSTFIESYDLSGKTVVSFCTSGSSGFGSSDAALRSAAGDATWLQGHRFSAGASAEDILAWADSLGLDLNP